MMKWSGSTSSSILNEGRVKRETLNDFRYKVEQKDEQIS